MADWADEKALELHREYFSARICEGGCRFTALVAAALRGAYEAGRASRRPRTYNTHKPQELVGERDGWTCHYCGCLLVPSEYHHVELTPRKQLLEHGSPFEVEIKDRLKRGALYATIDHVVPHSKGGSDEPDNLVLSCSYCNSNKSARSTEKAL